MYNSIRKICYFLNNKSDNFCCWHTYSYFPYTYWVDIYYLYVIQTLSYYFPLMNVNLSNDCKPDLKPYMYLHVIMHYMYSTLVWLIF